MRLSDEVSADTARNLATEIAWYGLSRALPAALSIATAWLLIGTLGRTEYGWFSILYAAANAGSMIACGWLTQGLLRFLPAHGIGQLNLREGLTPALGLALAFGLVLIAPAIFLLDPRWRTLVVMAASGIMVSGLTLHAIAGAILQAAIVPRRVAEIEFVRAALALILVLVACSWMKLGLLGAVTAFGASTLVSSCWGASAVAKSASHSRRSDAAPSALALGTLLRFGSPMSAWFALWLAFPLVDRALIERFLGIEETGLYAAIYDLGFRGCGFLLMPVVLTVHPRVMRSLHSVGPFGAKQLLFWGIAAEVAVSVVIVGAIAALAPLLLQLYFGDLSSGVNAMTLVLLCASGCVWNIALLAHKPLEIDQRTLSMLVLMATALAILTMGTIFGAPRFGLRAAAASNLAAGLFYTAGSLSLSAMFRSAARPRSASRPGDPA